MSADSKHCMSCDCSNILAWSPVRNHQESQWGGGVKCKMYSTVKHKTVGDIWPETSGLPKLDFFFFFFCCRRKFSLILKVECTFCTQINHCVCICNLSYVDFVVQCCCLYLEKIFKCHANTFPQCLSNTSTSVLVGKALSPAKTTSHSGNPWASVLISWFLVQVSEDKKKQNYQKRATKLLSLKKMIFFSYNNSSTVCPNLSIHYMGLWSETKKFFSSVAHLWD